MNQDSIGYSEQIITHKQGALGVITLNRPNALNALSLEMIRQMAVTLKQWEGDDDIKAVLFVGAGGRAFCSGGDVKSFYNSGMDYRRGHVNLSVPSLYFAEEYSFNLQVFNYPKPTIAIMDGIVMGGGYGVAGHCKHRVSTQNTVFAMPEVRIGFFPDVGSVYHLARCPHNFGRYLALTGQHIGAGDMLAAKLADYYVNEDDIASLKNSLSEGDIDHAFAKYSQDFPEAKHFADQKDVIESIFDGLDVLKICSALRDVDSEWARETMECILSRAPTSVMVAARHMELTQNSSFEEVMEADFNLAQNFLANPNLYEGIRSVIIDRDHEPVWQPPTLDAVSPQEVERFFKPAPHKLCDVQIFS